MEPLHCPSRRPLVGWLSAGCAVLLLAAVGCGRTEPVAEGEAKPAEPAAGPTAEKPAPAAAVAEKPPASPAAGGRYQIEQVEQDRELVQLIGKLGFFGESVVEAWVFRYTGGLLEARLETDVEGKPTTGDPLPDNWKSLLASDDSLRSGAPGAMEKRGYIILAAMRPQLTVARALAPYQVHLGSLFASAPVGPLHALAPLHLEVNQQRPYRLFISAGPLAKRTGAGFNAWDEQLLPMRAPLVQAAPEAEEYHLGGGKDLTASKDLILLDRQRGYSRVRLRVRFLGDGEVSRLVEK